MNNPSNLEMQFFPLFDEKCTMQLSREIKEENKRIFFSYFSFEISLR
jgi:hypothetical protein